MLDKPIYRKNKPKINMNYDCSQAHVNTYNLLEHLEVIFNWVTYFSTNGKYNFRVLALSHAYKTSKNMRKIGMSEYKKYINILEV